MLGKRDGRRRRRGRWVCCVCVQGVWKEEASSRGGNSSGGSSSSGSSGGGDGRGVGIEVEKEGARGRRVLGKREVRRRRRGR